MSRRNNTIALAILFSIIVGVLLLALGNTFLYLLLVIAVPVLAIRIWEEINSTYVAQEPQPEKKQI